LPNKVKRENIPSQPKFFRNVARETRAKITCASADEHRVDFFRRTIRGL
jgi:hypothetical protein